MSDNSNTIKQAACLECRKSKVKCARLVDTETCQKCVNLGLKCVVPDYRVGRYKGVKNKRSGLEKAIHQVEEAVKRARTAGPGLQHQHALALERLIGNGKEATEAERHSRGPTDPLPDRGLSAEADEYTALPERDGDTEALVDHADNPLQLLAIASAIPEHQQNDTSPLSLSKTSPGDISTTSPEDDETLLFFSPLTSKLDVGVHLDPIALGLISDREARDLFTFFHSELSHTRWGLDEILHSADFVRARSAFLFTSILAAAALFLPNTAALSIRLNNHNKSLFRKIIEYGYRSVEIVLALMISIPWMQPGKTWSIDDETCLYLSTAMTIAIDLSLNKIVIPSSTIRPQAVMAKIAHADFIEAQKALNIDGHTEIAIESVLGRRHLRARERTWLALFSLDRGVCLARGRPWTVPTGPLIDTCDTWHVSDISDKHDGSLVASCVLRRDFGNLFSSLRNVCDNHQFRTGEGANIVKLLREKVEGFFTQWHNTWAFQICEENGQVPPYIEILVAHGKLSAYCSVVNHPTATSDVKQFFRAAGLTAALDVLQVAVQNETRLLSMPNNSVIMVSFAACFVLGLSTTRYNDKVYLAPHVKRSIQRAADVLERIGSTPLHRKGASALFGKHLKRIMRPYTASTTATDRDQGAPSNGAHQVVPLNTTVPYMLLPVHDHAQNTYPGFDSLTEDQLLDFIHNNKDDFGNPNIPYPTDDGLFMDWLDWPNAV